MASSHRVLAVLHEKGCFRTCRKTSASKIKNGLNDDKVSIILLTVKLSIGNAKQTL